MMNEKTTASERAIDGAARYLKKIGWVIIGKDLDPSEDRFPIVAETPGGELCFVDVFVGGAAKVGPAERSQAFKAESARFLATDCDSKYADRRKRYDRIDVCQTPGGRAFLRHQSIAAA